MFGIFSVLSLVLLTNSSPLNTHEEHRRTRRDTVRSWRRRWPNNRVPYTFASTTGHKTRIAFKQAIHEIERVSCVRFIEKTYQQDYVRVLNGKGCYSLVGRHGGMQDLSIGNGCGRKGIIIHEVMHLLGFFHEQSRLDRDEHVTIFRNNVMDDSKDQFDKYKHYEADTLGEPYDPDSIMHYGNFAFSENNRRTIIYKINPTKKLGQRERLSRIDIRQLNKLYRCSKSYLAGTESQPTNSGNSRGSTGVREITDNTHRPSRQTTDESSYRCQDNIWSSVTGECYYARNTGQCAFNYYRMRSICAETCGYCRKKKQCVDKSSYCSYFASIGYCRTNQLIREKCTKSCRLC